MQEQIRYGLDDLRSSETDSAYAKASADASDSRLRKTWGPA
jgi:hypothetical protein